MVNSQLFCCWQIFDYKGNNNQHCRKCKPQANENNKI